MVLKKKKSLTLSNPLLKGVFSTPIIGSAINIPPYEDIGVKFQGYAKELKSSGYVLKTQNRIHKQHTHNPAGNVIVWESVNKEVLYITYLVIEHTVLANYAANPAFGITFDDVYNQDRKFIYYPFGTTGTFCIDLTENPLIITKNLFISGGKSIPAPEVLVVHVFGYTV
jgi:hypothetical protein